MLPAGNTAGLAEMRLLTRPVANGSHGNISGTEEGEKDSGEPCFLQRDGGIGGSPVILCEADGGEVQGGGGA